MSKEKCGATDGEPIVFDNIDGEWSFTNAGNISPDTRECAVEILSKAFTSEIRISDLSEYNIANKAVYGFFDGVSEAESVVFGESLTLECGVCGSSFESRRKYRTHSQYCTEEGVKDKGRVENLTNLHSSESEYDIYKLRIEHLCDQERYWYIGQTNSLKQRLMDHLVSDTNEMSLPHGDELVTCTGYEVVSFDVVDGAETFEAAKELERKISLKTAIEEDTTNVLGGK